ncbi:hypothetical protein [Mucilaginibacter arboris]|uniref:Tetratricopeptide repeat protein n=1 Tax=Mucilaginibacter arboris TaxID=2682090 RepID=A0A7K1SV82_9SPHI|nr:hypothetical protein [Mucilaginibacter arboris]MVN21194.1 hypothetical protein [Mucilaginibacter arboris]
MDQIQNGQLPEFLKPLLAHPATANLSHLQALEALVQTYPQCSVFHLLLAKAAQNSEPGIAAKALQSAAVHAANREVLFRLIHQPELIKLPKPEVVYPFVLVPAAATLGSNASFTEEKSATEDDEIILLEETYPAETVDASFTEEKTALPQEENLSAETPFEETADASFTGEKLVTEQLSTQNDPLAYLNPEEAMAAENDLRVEDVGLNFINQSAEEIVFPMEEVAAPPEEDTAIQEAKPEIAHPSFTQEIDEEVYDEITAIEDIRIEPVKQVVVPEETAPAVITEPEKATEGPSVFTVQDKAEKDMLSSIASIDYFTFNNKFGQNPTQQLHNAEENSLENPEVDPENSVIPEEKEPETVSKYHDDKMPYTFMWWLDKTRKEYAGTYQPYIKHTTAQKTNPGLSVGPELHQQYIESIFHTKPPHGLAENNLKTAAEPPVKRKEDQLIERFIIEEPHIHPPSSEKLDTENKAKKSSEDADVLVTETLAKIYLDQMLYHKALDTYKKLLLKFPEKSRYFTDQIELIEKKIN